MSTERERAQCAGHVNTMERLTALETCNKVLKTDMENIDEKLENIVKLLHSRPSWFVCIIISFLLSLCGILITIIETAKH